MKSKIVALVLGCVMIPGLGAAQAPKSGTWTGTVLPPDSEIAPLTFDVSVKGDSLAIVIHAGDHGEFTTRDGHYGDGKITFAFDPGISVRCTLTWDAKEAFSGECLGEDGTVAAITMVPPKE